MSIRPLLLPSLTIPILANLPTIWLLLQHNNALRKRDALFSFGLYFDGHYWRRRCAGPSALLVLVPRCAVRWWFGLGLLWLGNRDCWMLCAQDLCCKNNRDSGEERGFSDVTKIIIKDTGGRYTHGLLVVVFLVRPTAGCSI